MPKARCSAHIKLHTTSRRWCRHLLTFIALILWAKVVDAQTNITLDDTDLFIEYSPATAWHASTVACATCLMPLNSTAHGGTWHDGEHVIPTTDEDDEPTVGDTDGDGTTSASQAASSTSINSQTQPSSTQTPTPTSASSAAPAQSSASDDNDSGDDDGGSDDDSGSDSDHGGNSGKGGSGKGSKRFVKRDETNPFESSGDDEDDPGFVDVPVTASINFTGTGIYVFAIIPLFPAPPSTTPTFTNLSFTLDGQMHGEYLHVPNATDPGTPTANSTASDKFLPNVNVFAVSELEDTQHNLVVNVGVDSVLLLDYIIFTAGPNDPTGTDGASSAQRTSGTSQDSANRKHDVSTFAGAIGGSVGVLGALSLGIFISIRFRRHRAHVRERRHRLAIAEPFTSWDHGEDGPEGDTDEERNFGQLRNTGQPVMAQANPAPFVPRYFPGSLPASPPPYNAAAPSVSVQSPLQISVSRAGFPVSVPSTIPPTISSPEAALNLHRTGSNQSYAERPPPTPSSEEARIVFGSDEDTDRERSGDIRPLPPPSPVADENDPMLGDSHEHEHADEPYRDNDDDTTEQDGILSPAVRRSSLRSYHSFSPSTSGSGSGIAGPSNASLSGSDRHFRRSSSLSFASNFEHTPDTSEPSESGPSTPRSKRLASQVSPTPTPGVHTLSNSTSLPTLIVAPIPTRSLASPSSADPLYKGEMIAYPLLQPNRVPLPMSTNASQETLARHDSRT